MRRAVYRFLLLGGLTLAACRLPATTARAPMAPEQPPSAAVADPLQAEPARTRDFTVDPPHAGPGARLTLMGQNLALPGTRIRVGGLEALWEVLARRVQGNVDMLAVTVPVGARTGVVEVIQQESARAAPLVVLQQLTLATDRLSLPQAGHSIQLSWTGTDTAGQLVDRPYVQWQVDPPGAADINASGVLTARTAATVRLSARNGVVRAVLATSPAPAATPAHSDTILLGVSSGEYLYGAEPIPSNLAGVGQDGLLTSLLPGPDATPFPEFAGVPASMVRVGRITDMLHPFRLPRSSGRFATGLLYVDSAAGRVRFLNLTSDSDLTKDVILTVVGGGLDLPPQIVNGSGLQASEVRLVEPWGLAVTEDPVYIRNTLTGRRMVLISDAGRNRVYAWFPDNSADPAEDRRPKDSVYTMLGGNLPAAATPVPAASASANPAEEIEPGDSTAVDRYGTVEAGNAGISLPRGLAAGSRIDSTTRIFVADSGYHRVRMLVRYAPVGNSPVGYVTTLLGTGKRGQGLALAPPEIPGNVSIGLSGPMDVAVHEARGSSPEVQQTLYVADTDNRSLVALRLESPTAFRGQPADGLRPTLRRMRRVQPSGRSLEYPIQLQATASTLANADADVLVCDSGANAVYRMTIPPFPSSAGDSRWAPVLVAVTEKRDITDAYLGLRMPTAAVPSARGAGFVWVADAFNRLVRELDSDAP
ncbi:MAG: hypothetical protein VKO21_01365 [Candidatus Sericytochromatia bacterium]|nr:hypothetical protein [Candidatus Sericytochromatia bacterium]